MTQDKSTMNKRGVQIPCYHGTSTKKAMKSILRNGFKDGTYWARHMEDALEFGGKYVFEVHFDEYVLGGWQFTHSAIPKERIHDVYIIHSDK